MSPFIYNQEFMREGLVGIVASVSLPLTFGEDLLAKKYFFLVFFLRKIGEKWGK